VKNGDGTWPKKLGKRQSVTKFRLQPSSYILMLSKPLLKNGSILNAKSAATVVAPHV